MTTTVAVRIALLLVLSIMPRYTEWLFSTTRMTFGHPLPTPILATPHLIACITNCHQGGVGSRMFGVMMWYNLSKTLGFELYMQDAIDDWFNFKLEADDYLSGVLEGGNFHPERCDMAGGAYEVRCMHTAWSVMSSFMTFELYDTQMSNLLRHWYSVDLRIIASRIYTEISSQRGPMIGMYCRFEENVPGVVTRKDWRQFRNLNEGDYRRMMAYVENRRFAGKGVTYLVLGDRAIHQFDRDNNVVLIESYIRARYALSPLQVQFVAIDVVSQTNFRILNAYSTNLFLHMAFHNINDNRAVLFADTFSGHVYDYNWHSVEDVFGGFDRVYWNKRLASVYMNKTRTSDYDELVSCFKQRVLSPTRTTKVKFIEHLADNKTIKNSTDQCTANFLRTEVQTFK